MVDFDVAAFIEKNKALLSPEEQQELAAGYLRNSDYQSKFNAAKTDLAKQRQAEDLYHLQLKQWETDNAERLRLAAIVEERLGVPLNQLAQSSNPNYLQTPAGDYVSKADLTALSEKIRQDLIKEMAPALTGTFHLAIHMPRYASDYQTRYGRVLDGQKFVDFCRENNISDADLGFKLYTADDERKYQEDQHKKDLDRVREETERAVLSRHHLPLVSDARPLMRSPLMRQPTFAPQQPTQPSAPAAPAAPAAPIVPVAPGVPVALAPAADLAARMQADFLAAKDR